MTETKLENKSKQAFSRWVPPFLSDDWWKQSNRNTKNQTTPKSLLFHTLLEWSSSFNLFPCYNFLEMLDLCILSVWCTVFHVHPWCTWFFSFNTIPLFIKKKGGHPSIYEVYNWGPKQSKTQITSIHHIKNQRNRKTSMIDIHSDSVLKKKSLNCVLESSKHRLFLSHQMHHIK